MKFNIIFTLSGPGGTIDCPNTGNPVEAKDMAALVKTLADKFPCLGFGLRMTAIRIVELTQ